MCRKRTRIIFCPKCCTLQLGTRHHVYPRRFFGESDDAPIFWLCRRCHNQLERLIPEKQELQPEDYVEILRQFLEE